MKTKTLKTKLDRVFSEYIRHSGADSNGNVKCCSCNKAFHWKEVDAGHFVSRRCLITRYEETNVHPQCRYCNRFCEGNTSGYALFMIKKYGKKWVEELNRRKSLVYKMIPDDYEELIEIYKQKIKELE